MTSDSPDPTLTWRLEWWPAPAAPETPEPYNGVGVRRFWLGVGTGDSRRVGSPAAVLILSPGFTGGVNDLDAVAAAVTQAGTGRIEVWCIERRNIRLEDVRGMELAEAAGDPRVALGYYFAGDPPGYAPLAQEAASFMRHWGLAVALADLRIVVQRAREAVGPEGSVFLGGHSLGGMISQCYAAWEFPEGPGHREIDGLILIDGAVGGPDWVRATGLAQYEAGARAVRGGEFYWEDAAKGATPRFGILGQVAAMAAALPAWRERPSLVAPLVPDLIELPPGVALTTEAALGLVIDAETGPIASYRAHVGRLESGVQASRHSGVQAGAPVPPERLDAQDHRFAAVPPERLTRGWIDFREAGELSDLQRVANALRQRDGANGIEWYAARMLNAEVDLSSNLDSRSPDTAGPAAKHGLRLWHHGAERFPVFGLVTGNSEQKRERYQWYAGTVATEDVTILDAPEQEHMDPLFAENDGRNRLIPALIEWLFSRLPSAGK
jgi:pimeloyl-ACP methyl ester carboxylesterase